MASFIRDWRAEQFIRGIGKKAAKNMKKACELVLATAQSNIPVDSGLTKKGLGYQVISQQMYIDGRVGVTKKSKRAYIAWWLEMGTVKMPAKPFLRRSVTSNSAQIVRLIQNGA